MVLTQRLIENRIDVPVVPFHCAAGSSGSSGQPLSRPSMSVTQWYCPCGTAFRKLA